ncbi:glycosyltransferase family 2 protein [Sphingomonas sp. ID0503]|uniref:glycosyltransferase family 2 protein n=1 Tax=Sphingomonas sp. ID0503 TaxID=3399691 RepID=UPI003AFB34E1
MPPVETLVLIVNYRTPELSIACLQSLAPEIAPGINAIIVDNDSGDGSAEKIAAAVEANGWGSWCRFRALPRNGGFAYGNNEALARWKAETGRPTPKYVWLLNPDTLVRPGAIGALTRFMDAHPTAGITGGRSEEMDGTAIYSAFRFHRPFNELLEALDFGPLHRLFASKIVAPAPVDHPIRADWVAGASMMVRGDLIDRIGFLDESYFMYFEETDFCLRAARAGAECWYVPESRIVHLVGASSGVTGATAKVKRRPRYWFESRRRYFAKNFGSGAFHAANAAWLFGRPVGRLLARLRGKPVTDPPHLWGDMIRHNYGSGA